MVHVNQTWPHWVNQMGRTQSKPLGTSMVCVIALNVKCRDMQHSVTLTPTTLIHNKLTQCYLVQHLLC